VLSDALRCTPRNVTGLVDALETARLVRREPHPTDRRATLVTLTDEGHATLAGWASRYEQLADRLFGDVTDGDLARFETTLADVLDRLRGDLPPER
jgi:DNA-binding MarR family transcriptional regulator